MTTFTAATIARIQFVADCAHEDCALTSLKNAKEQITNRSTVYAGYESTFAGVDMVQLKAIFEPALKARTKAAFTAEIEGIQRMMINAKIEADKQAEILSRPHRTAATLAVGDVVLFQGEAVKVVQVNHDARGFIDWSGEHVHSDSIAIGRMRDSAEYPAYYGDDAYILMSEDADAQPVDAPVYHIEPITPDVFRVMVQGQHVATATRQRNGKYNTEHGEGFQFLIDAAKAACDAMKAAAAPRAVAPVVEEAAPVITEAHAAQIAFFGGNDYASRRAIVEAAHAEALKLDKTQYFVEKYPKTMQYNEFTESEVEEARAMNDRYDTRGVNVARIDREWKNLNPAQRAEKREAAHAEALAEDRAFNSAWQAVARYLDCATLDAKQTARALTAAHLEALEEDERRARAGQRVPAATVAELDALGLRNLAEPLEAEASQPYAAKVYTRGYICRSIARALASYATHAAKYTRKDVQWLAEHTLDHAHRNLVITGEEYAEIFNLMQPEDARPLDILKALGCNLQSGAPAMEGLKRRV